MDRQMKNKILMHFSHPDLGIYKRKISRKKKEERKHANYQEKKLETKISTTQSTKEKLKFKILGGNLQKKESKILV